MTRHDMTMGGRLTWQSLPCTGRLLKASRACDSLPKAGGVWEGKGSEAVKCVAQEGWTLVAVGRIPFGPACFHALYQTGIRSQWNGQGCGMLGLWYTDGKLEINSEWKGRGRTNKAGQYQREGIWPGRTAWKFLLGEILDGSSKCQEKFWTKTNGNSFFKRNPSKLTSKSQVFPNLKFKNGKNPSKHKIKQKNTHVFWRINPTFKQVIRNQTYISKHEAPGKNFGRSLQEIGFFLNLPGKNSKGKTLGGEILRENPSIISQTKSLRWETSGWNRDWMHWINFCCAVLFLGKVVVIANSKHPLMIPPKQYVTKNPNHSPPLGVLWARLCHFCYLVGLRNQPKF